PYAIVANRNGILSNPVLSGVEYMIDKQDRDYLEPFGYNSIIERPATGQIMIYANVTAFQNVKSDLNNLNVRELLNTLEIQIDEALQRFVFDFNNPVTRLNIINSVAPILETVKDAGAISRYELVMDETNNTADIIADGFGIVDIGLWITGALTKIIARYTVNSEGSVSSGGFAAN
ncbi:MAG TPA: phage tail sheath C-terminal domain-containing protein, partial [Candidatus Bathyarchaeia archaeon]|nr:phage tail sheath C-terminal domain-containing protein [Candidatus Bathyarchaeia archaeon]